MAAGRTLITVDLVAAARRARRAAGVDGRSRSPRCSGRSGCPAAASATATARWPTSARRRCRTPCRCACRGANPVDATFIPVAADRRHAAAPRRARSTTTAQRAPTRDIRLVYWAGGNPFHHHQDLNRLRRALGRPDTVVVHEPFWTATARHADIVLPVTTTLERDDIGGGRNDTLRRSPCTAPSSPRPRRATTTRSSPRSPTGSASGTTFTEGRTARDWLEHLYERLAHALRERDGRESPSFDEFWARGRRASCPAGADDHTLFDRLPRRPGGPPAARRRAAGSSCFSETDRRLRLRRLPRPPGVARARRVARRRRARRGSRCMLIANQPGAAAAQPARRRRAQPGAQGRGPRADPHAPGRRRRARASPTATSCASSTTAARASRARSSTTALRPGVVQLSTGAWYDPRRPGGRRARCACTATPTSSPPDVGTSRLAQGCTGQHVLVEIAPHEGALPPIRAYEAPA